MIPRYSLPEMKIIWSSQRKYEIWLMIEIFAMEGMSMRGQVPKNVPKKLWEIFHRIRGKFDLKRIEELELSLKHDVLAFLTYVNEVAGEDSHFIHMGMTSSDVLDSCFNLQLLESSRLIEKRLVLVLEAIKNKALEYKYLRCIGRTHGVHAEPITYGIRFASFYEEFKRGLERLKFANKEVGTCAISGPVGVFGSLDPRIEEHVAKKLSEAFSLEIRPEPISTQIIPRDRHAAFFCTLGVIGASVERCAVNLRSLQMTEILEVEEPFSENQKGSSAMPHKKNPILGENLTGLSRLIRMAIIPAIENVSVWQERDISHSSVERVIGPNTTTLLDYALTKLAYVFKDLKINEENVRFNMDKSNNLWSSHKVLLALIEGGMNREEAYALVQKSAMQAWKEGKDFLEIIALDKSNPLNSNQVSKIAESANLSKDQVDEIFQRVFHE